MKLKIHNYIEGRTETMISEGQLDFERVAITGSKCIGPDGISITMRTQKRNTLYADNNCTVEFIFDESGEEYKWIEALTAFAKARAYVLKRFRGRL